MELKDKIKKRRLELGLTLEEVAQRIGVSTPTIQRYESGEIKNMRRDKIKKIADALNLSPAYLMDWDIQSKENISENINKNNEYKEIQIISRAAKKMTPEKRQKLLEMARIMFEDEFKGEEDE